MTKALEDELNLPRLEDALKAAQAENPSEPNAEVEAVANKLANVSMTQVAKSQDITGVQEHEAEVNDLYAQAMKAHKDLLDLGFNIEPKHAGANAFTPAMKALEIALKASQSKAARKMERIKLAMEQEAHTKEMNSGVEDGEIIEGGGGSITANRNDLMEKIRKGEI
jgi:hypothetical protein